VKLCLVIAGNPVRVTGGRPVGGQPGLVRLPFVEAVPLGLGSLVVSFGAWGEGALMF